MTLGEYLRGRRERLTPSDVGLPVHARRRTPGLRREEVAALAGVSVDYYTRLERGADRHPSPAVLSALADALRLDGERRRHLHRLAGHLPPSPPPAASRVSVGMTALLGTLRSHPAVVLDDVLDVVAWTPAAGLVLGDLERVEPGERNMVRLTLLDVGVRHRWLDWEAVAREAVAHLRHVAARRSGDVRITRLVDDLCRASADFVRWWPEQEVAARCDVPRRVRHPEAGALDLVHHVLLEEETEHRLVVYLPVDAASDPASGTSPWRS